MRLAVLWVLVYHAKLVIIVFLTALPVIRAVLPVPMEWDVTLAYLDTLKFHPPTLTASFVPMPTVINVALTLLLALTVLKPDMVLS